MAPQSRPSIQFWVEGKKGYGLGHINRSLIAARAAKRAGHDVAFVLIDAEDLPFEKSFYDPFSVGRTSRAELLDTLQSTAPQILVIDAAVYDPPVIRALQAARQQGVTVLGLGGRAGHSFNFDALFVPGFYLDPVLSNRFQGRVSHGWRNTLIQPVTKARPNRPVRRVIVLTGGDDPSDENATLPRWLDDCAADHILFTLVQGPRAGPFNLPPGRRADRFTILAGDPNISARFHEFDAAIAVFGLTVMELMAAGLPTLAMDPHGALPDLAWNDLLGRDFILDGRDRNAMPAQVQRLLAGWQPADGLLGLFQPGGGAFVDFIKDHVGDPKGAESRTA